MLGLGLQLTAEMKFQGYDQCRASVGTRVRGQVATDLLTVGVPPCVSMGCAKTATAAGLPCRHVGSANECELWSNVVVAV